MPLAINSTGQIAFSANTTDGLGGIWGTDLAGHLRSVVHSGDTIQIAPGDFRVVAVLSFLGGTGNADGRASGLSDNGDVAFWAGFTDGTSGMFVSDALTVPEPAALTLLAMGGRVCSSRHTSAIAAQIAREQQPLKSSSIQFNRASSVGGRRRWLVMTGLLLRRFAFLPQPLDFLRQGFDYRVGLALLAVALFDFGLQAIDHLLERGKLGLEHSQLVERHSRGSVVRLLRATESSITRLRC